MSALLHITSLDFRLSLSFQLADLLPLFSCLQRFADLVVDVKLFVGKGQGDEDEQAIYL